MQRNSGSAPFLARRAIAAAALALTATAASAATITIAVVNNPDMIEMKKLSADFEKSNPDIKLNWVVLEENVLRQRATTDITTGSGQFDVMMIGAYEAPQWGKRGWLSSHSNGTPALRRAGRPAMTY
jgi:sorbitol/mannitol transport system substrate-binding protein